MSFFQTFHEIAQTAMPIFCPKTVHYVPKSHQDALFFPISNGKITALMPILCQQNFHSHKKAPLSCPYFAKKKNIDSQKKTVLSYHFFKLVMKNPLLSYTYLIKNTVLSKLQHIMGQNGQQDAINFLFFRKNSSLSCPYFVKKVHLTKHTAIMPIFC